jgi:hypothetical protein
MSDCIIAPVWLLVNAWLLTTAWNIIHRLYPTENATAAVVHALIICYACITGCGILLGALELLSGYALLLTVAVIVLGMTFWMMWNPKKFRADTRIASHDTSPQMPRSQITAQSEVAWVAAWGLLFAAWGSHTFFSGLMQCPSDWDSLMYHMPLIDQWLQAHSLYAPDAFLWSNPGVGELLGLWIVAPFSGDYLIALMNLPSAILLGLGTVEFAWMLGLNRTLSHLCGFLVVSNSVVLRQLITAENDVLV